MSSNVFEYFVNNVDCLSKVFQSTCRYYVDDKFSDNEMTDKLLKKRQVMTQQRVKTDTF